MEPNWLLLELKWLLLELSRLLLERRLLFGALLAPFGAEAPYWSQSGSLEWSRLVILFGALLAPFGAQVPLWSGSSILELLWLPQWELNRLLLWS